MHRAVRSGTRSLARAAFVAVAAITGMLATAAGVAGQTEPHAQVVTLPDAIRMALEQNHDLRVARLEYEKAQEQADEAWGRTMPTLDAASTYTHNFEVPVNFIPARLFDPNAGEDELIPARFGAAHSWQFSLDASQPLFDPAVIVGVGAAGRFEQYQAEVVRGTSQQIVTRARLAFYDVLLAEEAARLNRESFERIRETLRDTRAMYEAGLTSEYEALRLEVELANVESDLLRADDAVRAARRSLAVELGLNAETPLQPAGSLATLDLEPGENDDVANRTVLQTAGIIEPEERSADELVALAREARSDLRQLALMEDLRRAELRLERWSYLPRVSVFGTYQLAAQGNEFDFFGPSRGAGTFAGVRVALPLFAGLQRPARIEQREAVVEQVHVQYADAAAQVEAQIRTLHEQATEARRRADAQGRAVAQAERGYRIASAEYREGLGSRLNVTDAEVALRRAEFNYAQAVYDYLAVRARLDEAIGSVPRPE